MTIRIPPFSFNFKDVHRLTPGPPGDSLTTSGPGCAWPNEPHGFLQLDPNERHGSRVSFSYFLVFVRLRGIDFVFLTPICSRILSGKITNWHSSNQIRWITNIPLNVEGTMWQLQLVGNKFNTKHQEPKELFLELLFTLDSIDRLKTLTDGESTGKQLLHK